MALKLNERYPGRFNSPTTQYPQGSFKNRTAPGAKDGSYLEQDWANDALAFLSSLLSGASITPNGNVDTVGASQYYTALQSLIGSDKFLKTANNLSDLTNVPAALSSLRLERLDQDTYETRIWSPDKRSYLLVQNRAWGMYSINDPAGVIPLGLGFGGTGAKDAPGARTNLELGNSATRNVGTGENQIPDMSAWASGGDSNAGWRRSPDGFIEQWGIIKASASTTVTTPIPFPNAMYTAIATGDPTYSNGVETAQAWVQSNNTFIISGAWVIAGTIGTTTNMNTSWRAWGR